jgi:C-terminal processing protease CtpA/Prc
LTKIVLQDGRVIIATTEAGTIAENRFKYGDVITKINGEEKKTMIDVHVSFI